MRGIQYVVDEEGNRKSVVIDLSEWGKLWEDLYDAMVAEARNDEPTLDWDSVKDSLKDTHGQ